MEGTSTHGASYGTAMSRLKGNQTEDVSWPNNIHKMCKNYLPAAFSCFYQNFKKLLDFFASNPSSLGNSHVSLLFANEEQKRAGT